MHNVGDIDSIEMVSDASRVPMNHNRERNYPFFRARDAVLASKAFPSDPATPPRQVALAIAYGVMVMALGIHKPKGRSRKWAAGQNGNATNRKDSLAPVDQVAWLPACQRTDDQLRCWPGVCVETQPPC